MPPSLTGRLSTHTHTHIHTYMHTHSAGVGRTGTFITIDSVLEQVEKDGMVDIAGTVNKIRQQRMNMVQTVVRKEGRRRG